jgi:hypothetical protein
MDAEPRGWPRSTETARAGFALAIAVAVLTLATFAIAIGTPPLSGPFCREGCLRYPFEAARDRFPRDFIWMYPGIALMVAWTGLLAFVHEATPAPHRTYSLLALVFGAGGSLVIAGDYFVQVTVLPPSLLAGESDGLALLSQYNPHGLFIALEELGYLLVGGSMACLAPVFWRLHRAVAWTGIACFLAGVAAWAGVSLAFGVNREYRFEVAVITLDFAAMLVMAVLLAVAWRRAPFRPASRPRF